LRLLSVLALLVPATLAASGNCPIEFGPAHGFAVPGSPAAIVSADFNSDGRPDLAVTTQQSTLTLSIYLQLQDGSFAPGATYSLPGGSGAMVEADFNGDGFPDLVIASGGLSILLGNGDGTFQPPVVIDGNAELYLLIGDVNGDGKLDVVTDTQNVFLGNGDGTFVVAGGGWSGTPLALADLDGDGISDLLIPGGYEHGHGDGVFDYPVSFYPYVFSWADVADMDGDGNLDIVSNNGVFFGQGQGVFTAPIAYAGGGFTASFGTAALADVDGDGILDIVAHDSNGLLILTGHADGSFSFPGHFAEPAPTQVLVGDVNLDGLPDVTFSTTDNHVISAYNRGAAKFSEIPVFNGSAVTGDFNGDGIPDVAGYQVDTLSEYATEIGYGDGTFSTVAQVDLGAAFQPTATGDVNLDGRDDVVIVQTDTVKVLVSGVDGTPASTAVLPSAGVASALLADLNNDGKLDVVAVGAEVDVFLGNGDGTFQNAIATALPHPASRGVVSEFTGDAALDIVVDQTGGGGFGGYPPELLSGNGDGTLGTPAPVGTFGSPWSAAVTGDFNLDGRPDLAFVYSNRSIVCSAYLRVLTGDGAGGFQQTFEVGLGGGPSCPGTVLGSADFDGDGREDIAIWEFEVGFPIATSLLVGDGAGSFGTGQAIGDDRVLVADYDEDGRPDVSPVLLNRIGIRFATAPALPAGLVGTGYSQAIATGGAVPPYSFSLTLGVLPPGLSLSSTGILLGTPTASGPFTFTVTATDSGGCTASKVFSLTILDTAPAPVISALVPNTLAPGTLGTLVEIDGTSFTGVSQVTGNAIPLTVEPPIDPAKLFVYIPPAMLANPGSIAVQVTNPSPGGGASNVVNLPVEKVVLTPQRLPGTVVGAAYSVDITASGGQGPYAYTIASGSLPPGLTLDPSTGTISGSPALGGLFFFKLQAQDSIGAVGTQPLQIFVYVTASALSFYTISPCRLVDTRRPAGPYGGPAIPGNGARRTFSALGQCGLPDDVKALAVNLTVVMPVGFGDFRVFPAGLGGTNASVINFTSSTRANNTIIPVNGYPAGSFTVQSDVSFYSTDFLIDVSGYFR
jgi:hypothetical protein